MAMAVGAGFVFMGGEVGKPTKTRVGKGVAVGLLWVGVGCGIGVDDGFMVGTTDDVNTTAVGAAVTNATGDASASGEAVGMSECGFTLGEMSGWVLMVQAVCNSAAMTIAPLLNFAKPK
jgi:hypothetical protein